MDRPWTSALVEERLSDAFREISSVGLYSAKRGDISLADGGRLTSLDLIALTRQLLPATPARPTMREALLTRARCRAGRVEASIDAICREFSWSRDTFDRRRLRGAELVAAAINAAKRVADAA